jgi:hypothetical protein
LFEDGHDIEADIAAVESGTLVAEQVS